MGYCISCFLFLGLHFLFRTAVWYLLLVLSLVIMLQLLQPWHLPQFPKIIIMSPWKCLEKFLQGEWTEYSLCTVKNMELCPLFSSRRKVPITICPCSTFKRDKNVCSRTYEHKEVSNTITLHLLKTYYVSKLSISSIYFITKIPKSKLLDILVYRGEHWDSKGHILA